jgi:5-methylcytosine-specific restriction enzyme subunit McrC
LKFNTCICISEYGVLYPDSNEGKSIDDSLLSRIIPEKSWYWLLENTNIAHHKIFTKLMRRNGVPCLQVMNYVGVLTTPFGCQIEVIPKVFTEESFASDEAEVGRRKLFQMLSSIGAIDFKSFHNASLKLFRQPLPEVLIGLFINEVTQVVKKGVRNDYVFEKSELPFLRGRLQISAQLRQPIGRQHLFQVEYDEFLPDRAENRLIHSALKKVVQLSRSYENQRVAKELLFLFDAIPESLLPSKDFKLWRNNRSMVHYQPVKPFCEYILNGQVPFSLVGKNNGLSILFPMNVLFEKYVAVVLRQQLEREYKLKEQASSEHLIKEHYAVKNYRSNPIFQLKPDILIHKDSENIAILDCKWKLLDSNSREKNYKISSSDMYQLYAYGNKYLKGRGKLFLIYPESDTFSEPLPVFKFDDDLELWVVPFKWSDKELDRVCFPTNDSFEFLKNKLHVVS